MHFSDSPFEHGLDMNHSWCLLQRPAQSGSTTPPCLMPGRRWILFVHGGPFDQQQSGLASQSKLRSNSTLVKRFVTICRVPIRRQQRSCCSELWTPERCSVENKGENVHVHPALSKFPRGHTSVGWGHELFSPPLNSTTPIRRLQINDWHKSSPRHTITQQPHGV